jgi:hypothetical protein
MFLFTSFVFILVKVPENNQIVVILLCNSHFAKQLDQDANIIVGQLGDERRILIEEILLSFRYFKGLAPIISMLR